MPELPHLPLRRVELEAARRKKPGFPGPAKNYRQHGAKLSRQVQGTLAGFNARRTPAGINPALVLRVKLDGSVDEEDWRRAGLVLVGHEDSRTLILFASDLELQKFRKELAAYQGGPKEGRKGAPYAGIFNAIDSVGPLQPADRIGRLFKQEGFDNPNRFDDGQNYSIDLEVWHTGSVPDCYDRLRQLREFITAENGTMPDSYVGPSIVLARVKGNGALVKRLLDLDTISSIDRPPRVSLRVATQLETALADFGVIPPPPEGAPGVCVIDSGITSAHPLLAPAVGEAAAIPGGNPADENGHGTMVAGVALYGDVRNCIDARRFVPLLQLFSARVLNAANRFDDDTLITSQMRRSIEYFKNTYGCRVFNASLGDVDQPYNGGKVSPWASILDHLAREHDIVIVVSAGNYDHTPTLAETPDHHITGYPNYLLNPAAKIIEPATGGIVLSVGALATSDAVPPIAGGDVIIRPIAATEQPSPFTRSGPGIGKAIKPEICEFGGNIAYHTTLRQTTDVDELSEISTNREYLDRFFQTARGTSFAAPRVAHLAGRIMAELPNRSANLIRALIALSAEVPAAAADLLDPIGDNAVLKVCGYGRPSFHRAIRSDSNRVVLIAENQIPFDNFHIYEVPIPPEIYSERGRKRISVSLAFDPPVRHSRIDYLGTKMSFRLIRGKSLEEVAAAFAKLPTKGEQEDGAEAVEAIRGSANCSLFPSPTLREGSTLQKATFSMTRGDSAYGDLYFLVVRCQREWALDEHGPQRYGIAVSIEHSAAVDLYATIQSRVRLPQRIRIRP